MPCRDYSYSKTVKQKKKRLERARISMTTLLLYHNSSFSTSLGFWVQGYMSSGAELIHLMLDLNPRLYSRRFAIGSFPGEIGKGRLNRRIAEYVMNIFSQSHSSKLLIPFERFKIKQSRSDQENEFEMGIGIWRRPREQISHCLIINYRERVLW